MLYTTGDMSLSVQQKLYICKTIELGMQRCGTVCECQTFRNPTLLKRVGLTYRASEFELGSRLGSGLETRTVYSYRLSTKHLEAKSAVRCMRQ